MAEATAEEKALANQGATAENLDDGSSGEGAPKAPPAPSNDPPPPKKGDDEVHGVPAKKPPTAEETAAAEKKAADDKAAADKKAADDEEAKGPLKNFITLDDPAGQAAIDLLKEAGLGPNAANKFFDKALETGNLEDIDVAGLEAKLGKAKATLVMAGVSSYYNGLADKSAATVKQTHDIFGGADNWTTVRDWAKAAEKADPALKAQINSVRGMLDEGGHKAAAGARELLRLFNAAPDTKGLGTQKLTVGTGSGTVIGTELTRADYLTELKAAHARNAKPTEIAAIDARRRAGKARGI